MAKKFLYLDLVLLAVLALEVPFSIYYGEVVIPFDKLGDSTYAYIANSIRIPTILASAAVGVVLAVSGVLLQSAFRNYLADPYISGTASGGAFGAVLGFLAALFIPVGDLFLFQQALAFTFAVLATLATLALGSRSRGPYGVLIAGVLMSFLFSALIMILVQYLLTIFPRVPPIDYWLFGQIYVVGYTKVWVSLAAAAVITAFALKYARLTDLLVINDEMVYSHGVDPNRFRLVLLLVSSLAVSLVVSNFGIIGFVGLMVPNLIRMIAPVGTRDAVLQSLLLSPAIMIISDDISRNFFGQFLPLSAVTSLMSFPVFVYYFAVRRDVDIRA